MASLWTPDGERPVGKTVGKGPTVDPSGPAPGAQRSADAARPELGDDEREHAEAMAREVAAVRDQLARTPAAVVVANHVMGFYELAAIHLSQQPPRFGEATVAIDAMSSVLDNLRGRLGENEDTLRDALSQLQVAFVQLQARERESEASSDRPGD